MLILKGFKIIVRAFTVFWSKILYGYCANVNKICPMYYTVVCLLALGSQNTDYVNTNLEQFICWAQGTYKHIFPLKTHRRSLQPQKVLRKNYMRENKVE